MSESEDLSAFSAPPPLNFSFLTKPIEEKAQTLAWQEKSLRKLSESKAIADELRKEIREEDGIEPGSTPTLGNSGERIIIKSNAQGGGGGVGGGGGGGCSTDSSGFALPLLSSIKKTLSFGHIETAEIVKIKPEDEHKGEGHNSPTVFQGFFGNERNIKKIESLTPSPSDSLVSSPIPK
jgi:hypothetical protein